MEDKNVSGGYKVILGMILIFYLVLIVDIEVMGVVLLSVRVVMLNNVDSVFLSNGGDVDFYDVFY